MYSVFTLTCNQISVFNTFEVAQHQREHNGASLGRCAKQGENGRLTETQRMSRTLWAFGREKQVGKVWPSEKEGRIHRAP